MQVPCPLGWCASLLCGVLHAAQYDALAATFNVLSLVVAEVSACILVLCTRQVATLQCLCGFEAAPNLHAIQWDCFLSSICCDSY
jgi:hypothetical protein